MKGIAGRVTSGLPTQARLECVDNTGAKVVQLITVLKKGGVARRYPSAGVGDMIRVTVRRGTPETRRQIYTAVIVRQTRPFRTAMPSLSRFSTRSPPSDRTRDIMT